MFTGLIEEIGEIKALEKTGGGLRLTVKCSLLLEDIFIDASIAVNGCCLTVTDFSDDSFQVTAIEETLKKTNLSGLVVGSQVNLERAMKAGDRLGGHNVQGHVDTVASVSHLEKHSTGTDIYYYIPKEGAEYLVDRGSVTIDGISLTIAEVREDKFKVSIIPHTWGKTIISQHQKDYKANIEFDINAKLIKKMIEPYLIKFQK